LHPGANDELSVVRWTAQPSGTFLLQGAARGLDFYTSTNFLAILNSERQLFSATISSKRNPPVFFHRTLTVSAGDTIDFVVNFGQNGSYFNDSTGIQFKLTQMP